MTAELLRRAAEKIDSALSEWEIGLSPQVAAPLAAWLRESADRCADRQAQWEAGPVWSGVGDDGAPAPMTAEQIRANVEHHWRHPLAFARAILGEQP